MYMKFKFWGMGLYISALKRVMKSKFYMFVSYQGENTNNQCLEQNKCNSDKISVQLTIFLMFYVVYLVELQNRAVIREQ